MIIVLTAGVLIIIGWALSAKVAPDENFYYFYKELFGRVLLVLFCYVVWKKWFKK